MSAGAGCGFARGYAMTIGPVLGIWTQVLFVGLGLGALIATSAIAFTLVKWAGVAYLVWRACGAARHRCRLRAQATTTTWRGPAPPACQRSRNSGALCPRARRTGLDAAPCVGHRRDSCRHAAQPASG